MLKIKIFNKIKIGFLNSSLVNLSINEILNIHFHLYLFPIYTNKYRLYNYSTYNEYNLTRFILEIPYLLDIAFIRNNYV
jgi:hypothetical protein